MDDDKRANLNNTTEEESYHLCLVYGIGQIVPVYLPDSVNADIGDSVFFELNGETMQATIKFIERCSVGSSTWKAVTIATQTSPIRATKYARIHQIKWDDYFNCRHQTT